MHIEEVTGDDLPATATHGFRIIYGDGPYDSLFFHWHERGEEEIENTLATQTGPDPLKDIKLESSMHQRTSYADILEALPRRLEELGMGAEVHAVLGEVVGRYGAGG